MNEVRVDEPMALPPAGEPAAASPTARRLWWGWGAVGMLGALAALAVRWIAAAPPTCAMRTLLGVPCPGCGTTRALAALMEGHLAEALALHPLAPLLALEGLVLWCGAGWWLWRRGRLPSPRPRTLEVAVVVHAAVYLALWLGRLASGTLPW